MDVQNWIFQICNWICFNETNFKLSSATKNLKYLSIHYISNLSIQIYK